MEVESWLRDRHAHLTHLHSHWTKKLAEDVEAKEAELQKLKEARENDRQAFLEAQKEGEEARVYIQKAEEQMRKVRDAKEQMALEIRAAIKVQSWWKMLMVRKCLGPYRKKKKAPVKGKK
jgi:uncharacterized protein YoxC